MGVHVTPTVLFNVSTFRASDAISTDSNQGVEENGIGSSSSKEDWEKWLEKNIT